MHSSTHTKAVRKRGARTLYCGPRIKMWTHRGPGARRDQGTRTTHIQRARGHPRERGCAARPARCARLGRAPGARPRPCAAPSPHARRCGAPLSAHAAWRRAGGPRGARRSGARAAMARRAAGARPGRARCAGRAVARVVAHALYVCKASWIKISCALIPVPNVKEVFSFLVTTFFFLASLSFVIITF